jgi:hypothetical protein
MQQCHLTCKSVIRSLLFAALLAHIHIACLHAEPRTIEAYGLPFQVLNYQSTGDGQVLINVHGTDQLVLETRVTPTVIREFFSNRVTFESLPLDGVFLFIKQALASQDRASAMLAMQGVISFADLSSPSVAAGVASIGAPDEVNLGFYKEVLSYTLKGTAAPTFIATLMKIVAAKDLVWLKEMHPSALISYGQALRIVLRDEMYTKIKERDVAQAKLVQQLQAACFGNEDVEVRTFRTLFERLESLPADADYATKLSDLVNQDATIKKYFGPLFHDALLEKINRSIQQGAGDRALELLAQLDWSKRTPRIHQLTTDALSKLPQESPAIFEQGQVKDYLVFISEKDPVIRENLIRTLEASIEFNRSDFPVANSFMKMLKLIRPDPNSLNDHLRIAIAQDLYAQKKNSAARLYIADASQIGVIDRVSLAFARMKANLLPILAILLSIVLLFVCIGFFLNRRALRKITRIIDVHDELGLEEDTDPRVFVTARGVKSEHSKYPYEYISAVYELGLSADASMKEIKAAYRSKMKGIHPDAVQSQQRDTGEFIHVKQVYERIIALRKELGLDL